MGVREDIIATWGRLWDNTPLEPKIIGDEEHSGVHLRMVMLQTSSDVYVPGALLSPPLAKRNGKGVLCVHQHAGQFHLGKSEPIGKAGDPNMFYALELAQRGYVTLTIDLLAFEQRRPQGDDRLAHLSHLDGPWYERFIATQLTMYGHTLKGRNVWDLHRAVDFLADQDGVDSARIGVIGHSLGGQSTLDIMLFDTRLAAGVCSCGISTWSSLLREGINHNMAAYAPGLLQITDMDGIVAALPPQAFFMSSGIADRIFPIDGVRQIGEQARASYEQVGMPDGFCLYEFPGGHGFPPEARTLGYAWLDRWLLC